MNMKSTVLKTLTGWLGFITSFMMVFIIDQNYKDSIIGDLLSFVLIILLIGSSILLWKACANIKPVFLRIFTLAIQFSALIVLTYYATVYYLVDIVGKKI